MPDIETLSASARALSGNKELTLREGANHAESPLLQSDVLLLLSADERAAKRGEIDRAALARRWHNTTLKTGDAELYVRYARRVHRLAVRTAWWERIATAHAAATRLHALRRLNKFCHHDG